MNRMNASVSVGGGGGRRGCLCTATIQRASWFSGGRERGREADRQAGRSDDFSREEKKSQRRTGSNLMRKKTRGFVRLGRVILRRGLIRSWILRSWIVDSGRCLAVFACSLFVSHAAVFGIYLLICFFRLFRQGFVGLVVLCACPVRSCPGWTGRVAQRAT